MMSFIKPYPPDWVRLLDFITPLNLQKDIDPKLELNYYKGWVSVPMPKLTGQMRSIKTDLGISIEQDHVSRRRTKINFGTLNQTQQKLTQAELWDNILENTLIEEVPAVVGRERGVIEPVKDKLESIPVLDGCDEIYRKEVSHGHLTKTIRTRLGLPVINPCRMIRNVLAEQGTLLYNHPIFRRMLSIWTTEWMVAFPTKGWSDLEIQGIADISYALSKNKFHQDVGVPQELEGTIDSSPFKWQLYRLFKRRELIAVGYAGYA